MSPPIGLATAQDLRQLGRSEVRWTMTGASMASISGIWNIDYYNGNSVVKQIVNGWTISPIVTLHSGTPGRNRDRLEQEL